MQEFTKLNGLRLLIDPETVSAVQDLEAMLDIPRRTAIMCVIGGESHVWTVKESYADVKSMIVDDDE